MLEAYLQKLSNLRTDRGRDRYPSATNHRAPHKPFLLLSILDLITQGIVQDNFIEPSFELVDTWNGYWQAVMPIGGKSTMAYPFPRLRSDGFWKLIANTGYDPESDYNVSSMAKCREIYAGAKLDDELFQYMVLPNSREKLGTILVQTYFHPKIQSVVIAQGITNQAAYKYARELVGQVAEDAKAFNDISEDNARQVRDAGFRKAIVRLYDHRCAMCGIRMLTPEGHTVVEAAHVIPWRDSHDDKPTNGLCLCRLCHWSFDEGLMSVGREYEVLVSDRVRLNNNIPAHIQPLADRQIFTPAVEKFWPAQSNLHHHRNRVFVQ